MNDTRSIIAKLIPHAKSDLIRDFGTAELFVRGCGYHNYTHGYDVATSAGQIAEHLYESGRVALRFLSLAPFAGWRHDARQGENHEEQSAAIAAAEMRKQGASDEDIATVARVIKGTKVVRIDGYRIMQSADPDDPEQATLADADLSSLGMRKGVYATLLLGIEQQHLNGAITLPSPTNGMDANPERDAMIRYLRFQFGLYDSHQFLLPISRRMYPHQQANRDEVGRMLDLYTADRISFSEMLASAKQLAMS